MTLLLGCLAIACLTPFAIYGIVSFVTEYRRTRRAELAQITRSRIDQLIRDSIHSTPRTDSPSAYSDTGDTSRARATR